MKYKINSKKEKLNSDFGNNKHIKRKMKKASEEKKKDTKKYFNR